MNILREGWFDRHATPPGNINVGPVELASSCMRACVFFKQSGEAFAGRQIASHSRAPCLASSPTGDRHDLSLNSVRFILPPCENQSEFYKWSLEYLADLESVFHAVDGCRVSRQHVRRMSCLFEMWNAGPSVRPKKLSVWGTLSPRPPTKFYTPAKFNNSVTSNN